MGKKIFLEELKSYYLSPFKIEFLEAVITEITEKAEKPNNPVSFFVDADGLLTEVEIGSRQLTDQELVNEVKRAAKQQQQAKKTVLRNIFKERVRRALAEQTALGENANNQETLTLIRELIGEEEET